MLFFVLIHFFKIFFCIERMDAFSLDGVRTYLKVHQKRLKAGDDLPTIKAIADIAGVHRDTERADEEHGEHDVDDVLDEVHEERGSCVVVGVEDAQHEQVHGEPDEPECESGEGELQTAHLLHLCLQEVNTPAVW